MHDPEFKLRPSKQYLAFLMLVTLFTSIIILSLAVSWFFKTFLLTVFFFYSAYQFFHALLLNKYAITMLTKKEGQSWLLSLGSEKIDAELCGSSTVTSFVAILRFKIPHQFFLKSCVVFRDAMNQGDYRKLLVVLRMCS